MRVKTYEVLGRAVEEGASRGYSRAYKYSDSPSETTLLDEVTSAILAEICEYFDFDDEQEIESVSAQDSEDVWADDESFVGCDCVDGQDDESY